MELLLTVARRSRLRNLLFFLAIIALPRVSQAELILSIDWDPVTPGVQTILGATAQSGDIVTASIVAELTGGTTLYAYRVSVRYDFDRLFFIARQELPPPGFIATHTPPIADSAPNPSVPRSGDGFGSFSELWRFDGEEETGSGFLTASSAGVGSGVVLGVINFELLSTSGSGPLIKAGFYETPSGKDEPGEVRLDHLTGNDGLIGAPLTSGAPPNPDTTLVVQFGSITAVPEPSSLLFIASIAIIGLFRRWLGVLGFRFGAHLKHPDF